MLMGLSTLVTQDTWHQHPFPTPSIKLSLVANLPQQQSHSIKAHLGTFPLNQTVPHQETLGLGFLITFQAVLTLVAGIRSAILDNLGSSGLDLSSLVFDLVRQGSICLRLSPIWSDAAPMALDVAPPTSIEAISRLSHLRRFRSGPTKVRRPSMSHLRLRIEAISRLSHLRGFRSGPTKVRRHSMSHLRLRLRPLAGCRTSEGSDLDLRRSDATPTTSPYL
ncbi:hypothetical protein Acr_21g0002070 [Actinidia rufa]|uniref:Uncharacterized protein n=1 Tax=Actinidia rufa TaxID=165716 RepID=A0A7J0GFX8_9ERIC|nr:hypothetical protein Acr_21g0002070 [Actinidia rufa]